MPQPDGSPGNYKQTNKVLKYYFLFQVDTAFSTFDTNSDGMLNYKEFCIMITRKEQERWEGIFSQTKLLEKTFFTDSTPPDRFKIKI